MTEGTNLSCKYLAHHNFQLESNTIVITTAAAAAAAAAVVTLLPSARSSARG